ncbi:MAG: site-2 protease family protein [Candidatus Thermoplasmatota archaeon]|nr:site-2 protease family protein [Candidatus Thermoplasmatota archaeon]
MGYDDDHDISLSLNSMGFTNPRYTKNRAVGIKFSKQEVKELGIAIAVLTVAFAFAVPNRGILMTGLEGLNEVALKSFLFYLPISLVAVSTAFALHEMSHKFVANIYGYPAAFSYSRRGLIFAVLLAIFLGFLIAAPGAVFIYGYPSRKQNGIISLAGPLTNTVVGIIAFTAAVVAGILGLGIVFSGLAFVSFINFFLGAFNLIPVMPLDGAKVWKWSKVVYIIMALILFPTVLLWMWGIQFF